MHPVKRSTGPSSPPFGKPPTSPIHTPGASGNGVGEGTTPYNAVDHELDVDSEDLEARGYLRGDESEDDTSIGPDVEMRIADEIADGDLEGDRTKTKASSPNSSSRNTRLTMLQLERFKRAIAAGKDKRRHSRRTSSSQWEAKARRGEGFDSVFQETPGLGDDAYGTGPPRELRIVNYPFAMWILGVLIVVAASIFVDQIHKNAKKKMLLGLMEIDIVNWWKYLIAGFVYFIGASVIVNGRVETFTMNKETLLVTIKSWKPLCVSHKFRRTRVIEKELRSILDVRVDASGEILNGEVDTRAYKVHFDFDDGTHTTTLETRSKKKALVRCRLIKQYLLCCAPVAVQGASPTNGNSSPGAAGQALPAINVRPAPPIRSASGNLTLAVPAPLAMPVAAAVAAASHAMSDSPRRVMMVAAVPSMRTLSSSTASGLGLRPVSTTSGPTSHSKVQQGSA